MTIRTPIARANTAVAKAKKAIRRVTPEPSRWDMPLALSGLAPWLKSPGAVVERKDQEAK